MKKKKQIIPSKTSRVEKKKPQLNRQNFVYGAIIVGALFATFFLVFHTKDTKEDVASSSLENVPTSTLESAGPEIGCTFHRKLDGVCVPTQEEVNPPIIGVMVENSLDAQPLSGVAQASIVYEAPAEGNIPRFLTIFPLDTKVEKVGPVRSARPYYIDWLSEYGDAMYMHVGGSPEALQNIRSFGVFDMNEFYNGNSFWRATNRFAPHNTYTSSDLWNTAHEKNIEEFKNDEYVGWQYNQQEVCKGECIKKIVVAFSPAYTIQWKYNDETGLFERSLNGRVQKDEDGTAYNANNVILQETRITVIDELGRKKISTVGEGTAKIFSGGRITVGTWKKNSRTSPTQWFDEQGSEVRLAPGKTWVEVIGATMTGSWE